MNITDPAIANVVGLRLLESSKFPAIHHIGHGLYVAQYQCMKLVPALYIIKHAIASGLLPPGGVAIESSSGTMGLGLGVATSVTGRTCHLVSDPAIDGIMENRLANLGTNVEIVGPDSNGSYQHSRLARLDTIRRQNPSAFWTRQYDNPLNAESYVEIADFIAARIGRRIDHLVSPTGSGGNLSGKTRRLRERGHPCRATAVDTPRSVLFGQSDGKRLLRGLGNSILPQNLHHELIDEVQWVPAEYSFNAARWIQRNLALDVGPTSGAAFLAAIRVQDRFPGQTTIVVFPDDGQRYRSDVLSARWLAQHCLLMDPMNQSPRLVSDPLRADDGWCWMHWNRRPLSPIGHQPGDAR